MASAFAGLFPGALSPSARSGRSALCRMRPPRMAVGFGGLTKGTKKKDAGLPATDALCACGSAKEYGQCCRMFHTGKRVPRMAEELLRARYTAYAFELPTFIMQTTLGSEREKDRKAWRAEILKFCKTFQFDEGVEVLELTMTGPHSTTILFRAKMTQRGEEVSFVERSKFEQVNGTWFYESGKLVEVEGDSAP